MTPFAATSLSEEPSPSPLAEVTALLAGVIGLRLAADAVQDLWERGEGDMGGDRTTARWELLKSTEQVTAWYESLSASLMTGRKVPVPLDRDESADQRLVDALRRDLRGHRRQGQWHSGAHDMDRGSS